MGGGALAQARFLHPHLPRPLARQNGVYTTAACPACLRWFGDRGRPGTKWGQTRMICRKLAEIPSNFGPCAVTIGNFDGVHAGHRHILRRVAALAREYG